MLDKIFNSDSIQSYLDTGYNWFGMDMEKNVQQFFNTLLNWWFGLLKLFVDAINFIIGKVYGLDILTTKANEIFSTSHGVWEKLYHTFGVVFFSFVLIFVVKDFMKNGLQKVFLRLAMFTTLFFLSSGFFSMGPSMVKDINTITQQAQNQLVGIMSPKANKLTTSLLKEFEQNEKQNSVQVVQNTLYSSFVLQPFALMNFGKAEIPLADYNKYLIKSGDDEESRQDEIEDAVKDAAKKNPYFTVKKMQDKVAILLNETIMLLVIGAVVLLISILNFIIQILVLALVLIFGILAMIALFPDKEQVLYNGFKLFGMLFGGKVALGMGFGLLFTLLNITDEAFGTVNIVTVIASLLIKLGLFYLIFKNWRSVLNLLTQGKYQQFQMPNMRYIPALHANRQEKNYQNSMKQMNSEKLSTEVEQSKVELESAKIHRENILMSMDHTNQSPDISQIANNQTVAPEKDTNAPSGNNNENPIEKSEPDFVEPTLDNSHDRNVEPVPVTVVEDIPSETDILSGESPNTAQASDIVLREQSRENVEDSEIEKVDERTTDEQTQEIRVQEKVHEGLQEAENFEEIQENEPDDFQHELAQLRGEQVNEI
jgi:hypothetical protein